MIDMRQIMAAGLALGMAGCAQANGPVLGEWRGDQPGRSSNSPKSVDLVLNGTPDAQSGHYYITSTQENPNLLSNNGTREWGGTWTSTPRAVDGQTVKIIILHDHLPDDVGGYALAADGRLHALDPNGTINATPDGALYTLSPIRPRGVN